MTKKGAKAIKFQKFVSKNLLLYIYAKSLRRCCNIFLMEVLGGSIARVKSPKAVSLTLIGLG